MYKWERAIHDLRAKNKPLDFLEYEDFGYHPMRQQYLDDYEAEVIPPSPEEIRSRDSNHYTLCWAPGFIRGTPFERGQEVAEVFAFEFIWHWLRGGTDISDIISNAHTAADKYYKNMEICRCTSLLGNSQ